MQESRKSVRQNTIPSLSPDPGFEYYFKACRKGDATAKAVTVGESAVRVLADASEITGLPRDNFEVHEITREEFEDFQAVLLLQSSEAIRKVAGSQLPSVPLPVGS